MSRTETPPPQNVPPATAEQVRQALVGRHVCPYCGNQSAGAVEACPRCTMEDTPATRQATKARLGPWYVLQSRNPSAPGMKFATLLVLVRKGLVTPRAVLRGPTTYQLWRFAAHVRGVSREFGLCYSCGSSIIKTASFCPHCQRSQEPPADPDALLEQRAAATTPAATPAPDTAPINLPSRAIRRRQTVAPSYDPQQTNALAQLKWSPPVRKNSSQVVSAMDLAVALRGETPQSMLVPSRRKLKLAVALLVITAGAVAGTFHARPEYQQQTITWLQTNWNKVQAKAVAMGWRAGPKAPANSAPMNNIAPAPSKPEAPVLVDAAQAQPERQSAVVPDPKPETPAPQVDPVVAINQARALWSQAIDAEERQDFAKAVAIYEQIHKLPTTSWPGGLQIRLDLAKKSVQSSSAAQ
ncbi:MAG TPA: hypothetical protein VHD56_13360 [Tepidisphaeraceae bacterium]|nr:hypothetical protein [Tepidisphaeraceae bacterium]